MKFTNIRNPYWEDHHREWDFAWDHYTGKYADWDNSISKVSEYLHQKYQRENNKAYEERMKVSDVVLHFATIVDGINGVLASKEKDTVRDFGDLAVYDEEGELVPGCIADKILDNADGKGTNLIPLMKMVGIKNTVLHDIWGYVEGVTDTSEATINVIDPQHVVNWYPTEREPEAVLVKEVRDMRGSIYEKPDKDTDIYTLFTLEGWKRFKVEDDIEIEIESGEYDYYDNKDRKKRILPIFRTQIPMPRQVGYLLAQKENHLYNAVSVRDFALRNLSFAIFNPVVDSEEEYQSILNALEKGANIVPSYSEKGNHAFLSPESSYLADYEAVLQNKLEEYYTNGFKKFGEAASQVTATQVRLENQSGIESFLSLLVSSIDEFENQSYKRLEQVYYPDDTSKWGKAYVKRSTNFEAEDIEETFRKRAESVRTLRSVNSMSLHEAVQRINPTWDDETVEIEVKRIMSEMGGNLPDPFEG